VLGKAADDQSGWRVASGDVNNDGFEDLIIGAYWADSGDPSRDWAGETYVIFGSSSPPSTIDLSTESADITVCGAAAYDESGCAAASGDVNGDGYDDIIIGAYCAEPGYRDAAGETYVIFGSGSLPSTVDLKTQADITVCGAAYWDHSGCAVASGDVNGDGYDDIIVGAYGADPGGRTTAGETYVIFGKSFASPTTIDLSKESADITVCGAADDDQSGWAVASGDINGDGYDDVIIGAIWASPGERLYAGETYVIFGASLSSPPYTIDLSTDQADITVCGAAADVWSGWAVASGDVNGDGFDDFIIGARWADPGGLSNAGETYVIFGSSPSSPVTIDLNNTPADITVCGADAHDQSGYAVANGDVNGDGYDDIIIGAIGAEPGERFFAGETYVIFGASFSSPPYTIDLSTTPADITVCGADAEDFLGVAVASGDVNGDGYDELIIGATGADPGARSGAGETSLISGGGAFITAHGLGGKSWIKEFSLLTNSWNTFKAFGASNSQGEVHLAVADTDADGRDEIAAGHGEGGKSRVKLFEVNGSAISSFKAFGAANTNGEVHLAIGNFDAELSDNEIAVAHGEGGKSWVKVFETTCTSINSFKAFGVSNAQGEVHLAAGDLENADGIDEIVAGMGEGGNSWVKIFNYDGTLIRSFKAFGSAGNPGGEVHVAVGNFDADADLEIAVATGYNGGNKVRLFEKDGTFISQFDVFVLGGNPNSDVQITAADIDNDGVDELLCAHGEGGSSSVHVCKVDGTIIKNFKAFGAVNAQGEVHLGKSNY